MLQVIKEFSEKDIFILLESFNSLSKKKRNLIVSRDKLKIYDGFNSWIHGQKTMWKIYAAVDTNPCDTDHWLYKLFVEKLPE
jgi:hypothetical protein